MKAPLLVLRVGYMERYDGPDTITSGGAYIAENGVGGEVFNFKPSYGKCYGYAMSRHFSGVNLRFLDDSQKWKRGDELSGVDVVFIARRPGHGQVVVGWYRNATVYHREYRIRRGVIPGMPLVTGRKKAAAQDTPRHFLCVTTKDSAVLLSEERRTFEVPYAPAGFKGFPGQSNVWYPVQNERHAGVKAFNKKLRAYIQKATDALELKDEATAGDGPPKGGGRKGAPDHVHNALVEEAAVNTVWAFYEAANYQLNSVEEQCLGWDLEAVNGPRTLRVEVKGTAGVAIYFELTPNEYAKLKDHAATYRVCVVCEALTRPRLFELKPKLLGGVWRLVSEDGDVVVPLKERIAAVGAEVVSVKGKN